MTGAGAKDSIGAAMNLLGARPTNKQKGPMLARQDNDEGSRLPHLVATLKFEGLIGASAPCPPSAGHTDPPGFAPGRVALF